MPSIYEYTNCVVSRIVDGDTLYLKLTKSFSLDVDFGFYIFDHLELVKTSVQEFRLYGINTPEIIGESKVKGLEAKAELARLLSLGPIKVISVGKDSFGRWLATLFVKLSDGTELNINEELLKNNFAVPYQRK